MNWLETVQSDIFRLTDIKLHAKREPDWLAYWVRNNRGLLHYMKNTSISYLASFFPGGGTKLSRRISFSKPRSVRCSSTSEYDSLPDKPSTSDTKPWSAEIYLHVSNVEFRLKTCSKYEYNMVIFENQHQSFCEMYCLLQRGLNEKFDIVYAFVYYTERIF